MQHTVSLSLQSGNQVIPSTKTLKVSPGDTIAFVSSDGEVDITFKPTTAVDTKLGLNRVRVLSAPFTFSCQLTTKDGRKLGWGQEGSGGTGEPNDPH